jgi:hypothetical protein
MKYTGTTDILLNVKSIDGELKEYKIPHDLKHGDEISLWAGKMIQGETQPCVDTQISRSFKVNFCKELQELLEEDK